MQLANQKTMSPLGHLVSPLVSISIVVVGLITLVCIRHLNNFIIAILGPCITCTSFRRCRILSEYVRMIRNIQHWKWIVRIPLIIYVSQMYMAKRRNCFDNLYHDAPIICILSKKESIHSVHISIITFNLMKINIVKCYQFSNHFFMSLHAPKVSSSCVCDIRSVKVHMGQIQNSQLNIQ